MADQLFDELGLNKREAKEIVELFFDEILDSLENNVQVKLSGFGNFDLREKASARAVILRPVKKFRSVPVVWSRFVRVKSSSLAWKRFPPRHRQRTRA